jgi:hypothetical protein
MSMAALPVVESLDVIEQVAASFLAAGLVAQPVMSAPSMTVPSWVMVRPSGPPEIGLSVVPFSTPVLTALGKPQET